MARKSSLRAVDGEFGDSPEAPGEFGDFPSAGQPRVEVPAPAVGETKDDKFIRLCEARGSKAVNAIGALVMLARPTSYSWTTAQRERLVEALRGAVTELETAFITAEKPRRKGSDKQLIFRL